MKRINPIRGREKIHTIACYDNVWNKFQTMKHKHSLTADEALNTLVNTYNQTSVQKEKAILLNLKKLIENKIKKL